MPVRTTKAQSRLAPLLLRMLGVEFRVRTNCPKLRSELADAFAPYHAETSTTAAISIGLLRRGGHWELRAGQGRAIVPDLYGWPGADHLILCALFRARPDLAFVHASCVRGPHGALLFIGASNCGKSTLAAALDTAGWPLLCDDVTPLHLASRCVLPFRLYTPTSSDDGELPVSHAFFIDPPPGTPREVPTGSRWHTMRALCGDAIQPEAFPDSIRMHVRRPEDFARQPSLRECPKSEAMRLLMKHVFPPRDHAATLFVPLARFSANIQCHHLRTGFLQPTLALVRNAAESLP